MKKIIILSLCFMLSDFCAPAFAQETLSLQECREMALKYNKEMAALPIFRVSTWIIR